MRISSANQQLTLFLLSFLAVAIGFFVPVSTISWISIFIKIIIFLGLIYILYYLIFLTGKFVNENKIYENKNEYNSNSDNELIVSSIDIESNTGFGDAFHWYANEFVKLIKNASGVDCCALYLQKGKDGLEFLVGISNNDPVTNRLMISDDNLVYEVVQQKSPILESNLPIGTIMSGLPQIEIRSFIGVPMIYSNEIVGVLAVGSFTPDDFRDDDIKLMCQRGQIISQVMVNYHKGLRWEMHQRVYDVHLSLEKKLLNENDQENCIFTFVQGIKSMFLFDRFSLCLKDGDEGIVKYVYGQIDDIDLNYRFSLNDGLTGWVIKRNTPLLVSDINKGDYKRQRYSENENKKHGLRSFLIIPLSTNDEAWGCINLESRAVNQYSENAKDVLLNLSVLLISALKRINNNNEGDLLNG